MWPFKRRGPAPDEAMAEPASADAALRLGTPTPRGVTWSVGLTWFMRLTALLWIAKGLSFWAVIIGAGEVLPLFQNRSFGFQTAVTYFAVVDLIAAVGLWLTATWGGVLWLLAVMSHLILALFLPGVVPVSTTLAGVYCGLMVTYLLISWLASGEEG